MWDVTENLLYIQQCERLFSAVHKFQQNAENVRSQNIWNGLDDGLVLLTAVSPTDMARIHLSDDFIQLVPY
jgi:hypothetical protein